MKIRVIGAGIMGLATAWALARGRATVEVVEQATVPNPRGSSVDRHRLIRYPYGASRGYTRMVRDAYAAWDRMWADLGATHYAATGTLALDSDGDFAATSAKVMAGEGVAFRELDAGALAREFPIVRGTARYALHSPTGGALFADAIVRDLARWLRDKGVAIRDNTRAALDTHDVDALVVAAGPWINDLMPDLAPRVTPSRQVVVYLDPPADLQAAWMSHPMLLDIHPATGFYLVPPRGHAGLKIGDHAFTLTGHPDDDRRAREDETKRIVELARRRLARFEEYRIGEAKTCFYDATDDERFVIARRGKIWVLSGFSGHGFKFASVIGERVAAAIRADEDGVALASWAAGK